MTKCIPFVLEGGAYGAVVVLFNVVAAGAAGVEEGACRWETVTLVNEPITCRGLAPKLSHPNIDLLLTALIY